jgi:hypothetical protein
MRILVLAAALGAVAIPTTSLNAHPGHGYRDHSGDRSEIRQERRECRRELRRADSHREYRRELRECRRELAQARRDYRYNSRRYGPPYGNAWGYCCEDRRGYSSRYDDRRYWDGYRWRYRY